MANKLVSTLIFSGQPEACKCEIYQQKMGEKIKFRAMLYICRKVLIKRQVGAVTPSHGDTPDDKYLDTWILARVLHDIDDCTLERAEITLERRYQYEPFFIPAGFESTSC